MGTHKPVMEMVKKREEKVVIGVADSFSSDFLGLLVNPYHDVDEKSRLSVEDLVGQCKTFYTAGQEDSPGFSNPHRTEEMTRLNRFGAVGTTHEGQSFKDVSTTHRKGKEIWQQVLNKDEGEDCEFGEIDVIGLGSYLQKIKVVDGWAYRVGPPIGCGELEGSYGVNMVDCGGGLVILPRNMGSFSKHWEFGSTSEMEKANQVEFMYEENLNGEKSCGLIKPIFKKTLVVNCGEAGLGLEGEKSNGWKNKVVKLNDRMNLTEETIKQSGGGGSISRETSNNVDEGLTLVNMIKKMKKSKSKSSFRINGGLIRRGLVMRSGKNMKLNKAKCEKIEMVNKMDLVQMGDKGRPDSVEKGVQGIIKGKEPIGRGKAGKNAKEVVYGESNESLPEIMTSETDDQLENSNLKKEGETTWNTACKLGLFFVDSKEAVTNEFTRLEREMMAEWTIRVDALGGKEMYKGVWVDSDGASREERLKIELWDTLIEKMREFEVPWCLGGDFNVVLRLDERLGAYSDHKEMEASQNFVNTDELVDLPMADSKFAWANNRDDVVFSSLDRFLVDELMLERFQFMRQWCLPSSLSYHNSVVLGEKCVQWGPKLFRFFNHWLEDNGFQEVFAEAWKKSTSSRKRKNMIDCLKINGMVAEDPQGIREEVTRYFEKLYEDQNVVELRDWELEIKMLSNGFARSLEEPFSKKELYRNEMVFDGSTWDACKVMEIIKIRMAWWVKCKWPQDNLDTLEIVRFSHLVTILTKREKVKVQVQWKIPPNGWVKFNIDGAAKGCPGPLGIGGVLRNEKGIVKMLFSKTGGWGDANLTKMLAIREALILFMAADWCHPFDFFIETDFINAITWVLKPLSSPWSLRNLMLKIKALLSKIPRWQIIHTSRFGNELADSLAKLGVERATDLLQVLL
ncbi:Uncharacterized protein TCM_011459 [Theobroma cacao]|uniref:RNase H type-1 domain-containing protein n=1 Tax=Theobroma cacao TaxID=3641 RepID=A0A061EH22_THECC|nr:Uncharacterized protein TCM_011459 [Theobroma cacao]